MRAPGPSLSISGGDYMLGGLWLKPAQIDALSTHHATAIVQAAAARDDAAVSHHAAWLGDLNRAVAARADHRRAAQALAAWRRPDGRRARPS
jgi:hypothetical protein